MKMTCSSAGTRSPRLILGAADQHRGLRRAQPPRPPRQRRPGSPGPAGRRPPPPPQPQLEQRGVPGAGVQPQPQPQPHVPHPVAGQPPLRPHRPPRRTAPRPPRRRRRPAAARPAGPASAPPAAPRRPPRSTPPPRCRTCRARCPAARGQLAFIARPPSAWFPGVPPGARGHGGPARGARFPGCSRSPRPPRWPAWTPRPAARWPGPGAARPARSSGPASSARPAARAAPGRAVPGRVPGRGWRAAARSSAASRSRSSRSPARSASRAAIRRRSLVPDVLHQAGGIGRACCKLGAQAVGLPSAQARSSSRSRAASASAWVTVWLRIGPHPVELAADLGLGGARPVRLVAGLPQPGRQHAPTASSRWPMARAICSSAACRTASSSATWPGRRPGATGQSVTTQARNPASVDPGASASRSSHSASPPTRASGVGPSSASASPGRGRRASTQARTTPISVSEASAYTAAGITQIARSRHPCPAASAFIASEIPMHASVQRPGPQRPLAVQRQRHAQRGEHHRARVRDARLQRGHPGRLLDRARPSRTAPASSPPPPRRPARPARRPRSAATSPACPARRRPA